MRTRIGLLSLLLFVLTFSAVGQTSKTLPNSTSAPVPGDIKLLEGYKHIKKRGIDSSVGEISKDGGLTIRYDIGRMAGLYAAQCLVRENCVWFKRQMVNGSEVWLGLTKEGEIIATFRNDYANFFAKTKSPEEMVDFLMMVLTYRSYNKTPPEK
jgi:hypothetical protein